MLKKIIACTILTLTAGCLQSPPVSAPPPACSELIPADWVKGVAHAPAPTGQIDDLGRLKAWIGFGTAEAGNVEIANGRTRDAVGIIQRCEARDAAAVRKAARDKFLGLF